MHASVASLIATYLRKIIIIFNICRAQRIGIRMTCCKSRVAAVIWLSLRSRPFYRTRRIEARRRDRLRLTDLSSSSFGCNVLQLAINSKSDDHSDCIESVVSLICLPRLRAETPELTLWRPCGSRECPVNERSIRLLLNDFEQSLADLLVSLPFSSCFSCLTLCIHSGLCF